MTRKSRKNPLTKFAEQAFADQDEHFLQGMRESQEEYDFEAASLALSEWTGRGHEEMRAHGLRVIADYVRAEFNWVYDAANWLTKENRRLGVWCACACVRGVLKYIPKEDHRILIETAEEWVEGTASKKQVENAINAIEISPRQSSPAAFALHSLINIAEAIDDDDFAPEAIASSVDSTAVSMACAEVGEDSNLYDTVRKNKLRLLVDVLADAILTFPRKR